MKSNFPAFPRRLIEEDLSRQTAVITRCTIYSAWQPFPLSSVMLFCDGIVIFGVGSRQSISKFLFLPLICYIISHYLIQEASVISDNTVYILLQKKF